MYIQSKYCIEIHTRKYIKYPYHNEPKNYSIIKSYEILSTNIIGAYVHSVRLKYCLAMRKRK